jgi:hypothetical protein
LHIKKKKKKKGTPTYRGERLATKKTDARTNIVPLLKADVGEGRGGAVL